MAEPNGDGSALVTLVSVEDDAYGEELRVIWDLEPGRQIIDHVSLPEPKAGELDPPERLEAFLDAVRWGAITSADSRALQSPFRSGITIEDYQLDPVVRALRMPRVNLLIADDVGLGKTIEAGLVVQELLLRHRARTIFVVCPPSLCIKWREEMLEKFGLEFRVVDTALLRQLRRTRGLYANPWTHFPRLIVSIDWLKSERPLRLLKDVLPAGHTYPRRFDLLIVDEAHAIAPAGRGKYATDSLRTKAIRLLAPHFEHRLFLSATPHNGYAESFSALLELLDNQRFARGVTPRPEQLANIMVRRLKSELPPNPDGTPRFPERKLEALKVEYSAEERQAYARLLEYGELRAKTVAHGDARARLANEFVFTLLKKRLFSSPAAFAATLACHQQTLAGARPDKSVKASEGILRRTFEDAQGEFATEDEQSEAERSALEAGATVLPPPTSEERALLGEMSAWAEAASARLDAKGQVFLDYLSKVVCPKTADGKRDWTDERVIVFTEYRATQRWLQEMLAARGLGGGRVALLYGGMDERERERTKAEFQAAPSLSPVRILLATDAASEGIDLQLQCHRLIHYEIPWNPNRLEQRNGRVDRHGQRAFEVLVYHFVGSGYDQASPGSLDGDLEFLFVAAKKIEAIREDLGNVGPVIADQVMEAMLGRRQKLHTQGAESRAVARKMLKIERDVRVEIARLHEQLDESITELHLWPCNVERAVSTALDLARQPQLIETKLRGANGSPPARAFRLPALTGSWARASEGLAHPVTGELRPITFDHAAAAGRDDVVLVHLQHRLTQRALRLLRAEVWGVDGCQLHRVTARRIPSDFLQDPAVIVHGRLVITGADGHRLHEEVIAAGGVLRDGRLARLNVGQVKNVLEAATLEAPPAQAGEKLVADWARYSEALRAALDQRSRERTDSLMRKLEEQEAAQLSTIESVLYELKRSIETEFATINVPEQLALFPTEEERSQLRRDLDALHRRLEEIPTDIATEQEAIRRRYRNPEPRLFPVSVTFFVPTNEGAMP